MSRSRIVQVHIQQAKLSSDMAATATAIPLVSQWTPPLNCAYKHNKKGFSQRENAISKNYSASS